MIRLPLPYLIFAYLLIFLAAIFTVWIVYELARRYYEGRITRHRIRCALCGMEYEDRSPETLPRCPRCGGLNERSRIKNY